MEYLIPAVLSLVGGYILWILQKDRVSLTYTVDASEEFPRENSQGRYFICRVKNSGTKPVESIRFKVAIVGGEIDSVRYSKPDLFKTSSASEQVIDGEIPLLNPGEVLSVTVTINGAARDAMASFEARAVGVTAVPEQEASYTGPITTAVTAVTLGLMASFAFQAWASYGQSKTVEAIEKIADVGALEKSVGESGKTLESIDERMEQLKKLVAEREAEEKLAEKGSPETAQIVFSILNRSGLGRHMAGMVQTGDEISYWRTSLFLAYKYPSDKKNYEKYMKALQEISEVEKMSPSSRGFALYLASRIAKDHGSIDVAQSLLDRCKKETPLMYEYMMAQDASFNVGVIEASVR